MAIEKKAVERAIRPGAALRVISSPGSKASASQTATSSLIGRSSGFGVSGALGVSNLVSVAIVGGRPEPARCLRGNLTWPT